MKDAGKVFSIVGIVAVVLLIGAGIIFGSTHKTPNSEKVWDKETIVGNPDAENYFIIYSDIVCPYCVAFENAIIEHQEDFNQYIKDNDVLVEVRLSDFLYEYGQSNPISSRYSAEAVYCAKKEGKFWEYYDYVIPYVWNNFFKTLGKAAFTELNVKPKSFWSDLGKNIGLGEDFEKCVKNDETLDEIMTIAAKTAKQIDGMPYFKFNKYISSGFDLNWGWDYVKMYFDSGLKAK